MKSEVSKCIKTFVKEAKNAGNVIKQFLGDAGTELQNSEVRKSVEGEGTYTSSIHAIYTRTKWCS